MKKALSYFIFILSLSILLNSCDNNDRYYGDKVGSYLEYQFNCYSQADGYFDDRPINLHFNNLDNVDPMYDDVQDIRLNESWVELHGDFRQGDQINKLTFRVDGLGEFVCRNFLINRNANKLIIDDSNAPGLFRFMRDAMRQFTLDGNLLVSVRGYTNVYNGQRINVVVKNNLDVFVTDY